MASAQSHRFFAPLLVVSMLLVSACGSGATDGADPNWPGYGAGPNEGSGWIGFTYPYGPYETTDDSVAMGGTTFIPDGAQCPDNLGALGYQVTWFNDATGESGPALYGLNCLVLVFAWWETPAGMILLDPGVNHITLTSSDGSGNIGRATITLVRN